MRLPSVEDILDKARVAALRFPWVLLSAVLAVGFAIALSETPHPARQPRLLHFALAAYLGVPLNFALALLLERLRPPAALRLTAFPAALALLSLYAWSMDGQVEFLIGARFALLLLASVLFIAVAPYLGRPEGRGFWEFNHRLAMRALLTVIFTGALFAGLAGALAAVEHLFDIPIRDKVYFYLWLTATGIFAVWVFLAGVPDDFAALEEEHPYPKALKMLAQAILLPVVTLYLVILYAYAAKIILAGSWPVGWVSYLVLVCAVLGLGTLLLVHPLRERRETPWIPAYSRWFFLALFPLIVLLFAAIGRRIAEYRITENRYFVVVLACWLAGLAVHFSLGRARAIKVVPLSLGLLALLTAFGPWSAFQVSARSQKNRLEDLLARHGLLQEGRIGPAARPPARDTVAEIGSVVAYLDERKQLGILREWLPYPTSKRADTALANRHAFLKEMGLEFIPVNRYSKAPTKLHYTLMPQSGRPLRVEGFDYVLIGGQPGMVKEVYPATPGPDSVMARFEADKARVSLSLHGSPLLEFDLEPFVDSLRRDFPKAWHQDIPPGRMWLEKSAQGYRVGLQVQQISSEEDRKGFLTLRGTLLVDVPGAPRP